MAPQIPGGPFVSGTGSGQVPGGPFLSQEAEAGGGIVEGTGASTSVSTVAAIAAAIVIGVMSVDIGSTTTGTSTANANSVVVVSGIADSDGVSNVLGTSAVRIASVGTTAGTSVVSGISEGVTPTEGTGSSAGVGSAQALSVIVIQGTGGAAGTTVVNGQGDVAPAPVEGTGSSVGIGTVNGVGRSIVLTTASAAGLSTVNGIPSLETFLDGTGLSVGTGTANGFAESLTGVVANASGLADSDFVTGVVAGSVFSATGTATVLGESPPSLVPGTFKPIEQRRVRFPKLPRGIPAEQWIDISTREFDSFFNDMHHYLAANTFVSGVHTEILEESFTLTPETSIIFVMSNTAVTSSGAVAIKSVTNIPRIFMIVNTGLFPVTLKDGANTVLAGGDMTLQSGRLAIMIYTGAAWVGNAI